MAFDFNAEKYLEEQQKKKKKKKPQAKILRKEGQEDTFETKPFSVKNKDAGFEMKGKGSPDARIIGDAMPRPEDIV